FSTLHYLNDHDYWKEWFPAHFITENLSGQFRNWFYSLLAMSTALEKRASFRTVLGHALVKDEHGRDMHKSAGNAIWFDEAAEEMGVDAMRWMFATQNPEQNLLFGYGPAREIRKRLITLWNVYSFFVTYARLDKFDPRTVAVDEGSAAKLDRWISSKMNQLVALASESYGSFRVDRFMRRVDRFLDDLSNWYVRRNRRRFWKSGNDSDKNAAYATLYSVLVDLIKILAPVVPFVTEKIYQNLVRNLDSSVPESVHLSDFPTADKSAVDEDIIREIDAVVKLVEMGRYARNRAHLKIRQPLARLEYATDDSRVAQAILLNRDQIMDELNVKEVRQVKSARDLMDYRIEPNLPLLGERFGKELSRIRELLSETTYDDVATDLKGQGSVQLSHNGERYELFEDEIIVKEVPMDGKSAVTDGQLTVAVSTELTEDLVQEGIVRDMIRHVQNMRREADFNVEDRIAVTCDAAGKMASALQTFQDYFCNEVLAVDLKTGSGAGEYSKEISIQGEKIVFGISKTARETI
ncbi:MAG: DUF5915 domain-containing protein, partial [Fidelibacterota bacterium]